ncbi:dipeptide ABC transporter ATP-binding protein [Nonomuraea phyllanthi]|uniref:Dipeptide ABC transporter ATP-binding protein n=1 Tax=Nonomuraea phyllanthi TaxID=2219224 RepID=A0A5C4UY35_9ACTN|nr:dipeptide ABC transporter ATP-binding protein [Nonomuraea phyllanthi]KAB8183576.1 dipeptide ABC transporter ATP-binding protein [Nonomuraea phyllanthi]QFY09445.1 dipeptide ABC transporter ATP-binding protein [Nonomuraea phyllanthi]
MSSPADPLLSVRDLHTGFPIRSALLRRKVGTVQAVSGVSFDLPAGRTLGLVGESGSGKTTLARTVIGLAPPESGQVLFDGRDLLTLPGADLRQARRQMQMVFQDPYASLNPRLTVEQIISEAWLVNPGVVPRNRWATEVKDLLARVGLNPDHADRYPHQFSGGQRQRVGIARALALRPRLVICDEAVSALDVSVQAQVLNLLVDLQAELGLSFLFIAHDLSVVRHISDEVAVMYLGKVVETGTTEQIFTAPVHPYTQALLSAVPVPRPWAAPQRKQILLTGDIPSPVSPPSGCRFRTRCWKAQERCATEEPALADRLGGHSSACHFPEMTVPA